MIRCRLQACARLPSFVGACGPPAREHSLASPPPSRSVHHRNRPAHPINRHTRSPSTHSRCACTRAEATHMGTPWHSWECEGRLDCRNYRDDNPVIVCRLPGGGLQIGATGFTCLVHGSHGCLTFCLGAGWRPGSYRRERQHAKRDLFHSHIAAGRKSSWKKLGRVILAAARVGC